MQNKIFPITTPKQQTALLLNVFGGIVILSILLGIATEHYFLAGIPAVLLLAYVTLFDFKKIFFLLFAFIPLSIEMDLPGGFSTDLPTEPLTVGLMSIYFLYVVKNGREMPGSFIRHPLTLLLLLHLGWILVTAISSDLFFVSFKFFLAKIWYVAVFYFMAGSLLKRLNDLKVFFWSIFIPLCITVVYVLVRHAGEGFSYAEVNSVVWPFYRNHVNYACLLTLFFPFVWFAGKWYKKGSGKWWLLLFGGGLLLLGIQFSFTRAAYLSLLIAAATFFVVKYRLVKVALGLVTIVAVIGIFWLVNQEKYLDYAPNYERTITHYNFENLLEATYKGEDISTMERVYRWVAGMQMVKEKPFLGYGPGNFPRFYKSFTVTSFKTYVSDNPDSSGIHSYFFMTLIEQGVPGFLLFVALCFLALIKGEMIYHQTIDKSKKHIVMTMILTLVIILALLLINDMVETIKVGTFFFVCLAVLVNVDLENQRLRNEEMKMEETFG